jgi:hypothetical protein
VLARVPTRHARGACRSENGSAGATGNEYQVGLKLGSRWRSEQTSMSGEEGGQNGPEPQIAVSVI